MSFAADAVVVVHTVFVAFLLIGGFLAWWWPSVALIHVAVLLASAAIYLGGFDCPLTNLEKRLRTLSGQAVYPDGFIAHYLVRPFYAGGMTTVLGFGLLAVTVGATLVPPTAGTSSDGYAARRRVLSRRGPPSRSSRSGRCTPR